MHIFKLFGVSLLTLISTTLLADHVSDHHPLPERKMYLKFGAGASFSTKASVDKRSPFWDPATQGYNSDLGTAPVFDGALGYDFIPALSAELGISYRAHYSYKKHQTPPPGAVNTLGPKTRRFNLDATSLMLSLFLNGRGWDCMKWEVGPCGSYLFPFIAGGAGISELTIYNFRSTGLPANAEFVTPTVSFSAFGSSNPYTKRYRFSYQAMAGLEYRLLFSWGFELGYRWFSTMRFKGPSYLRDARGNAADIRGSEWKQRLSANEVFANIKYYF